MQSYKLTSLAPFDTLWEISAGMNSNIRITELSGKRLGLKTSRKENKGPNQNIINQFKLEIVQTPHSC